MSDLPDELKDRAARAVYDTLNGLTFGGVGLDWRSSSDGMRAVVDAVLAVVGELRADDVDLMRMVRELTAEVNALRAERDALRQVLGVAVELTTRHTPDAEES